jgi:serine protease inhibitor
MKTFKQILEAIKDKADEGEYDYEGDMAKSQLRSIIANSKRIHDMLEDTTNLPEWVQSKITLAEDYISTASNYMQSEMTEESEGAPVSAAPTTGVNNVVDPQNRLLFGGKKFKRKPQ